MGLGRGVHVFRIYRQPETMALGYVYNWECVGGCLICLQAERHRLVQVKAQTQKALLGSINTASASASATVSFTQKLSSLVVGKFTLGK